MSDGAAKGIVSRDSECLEREFANVDFLRDQYRLMSVDAILNRPALAPAYVWTGRGCSHGCFYCAENRKTGNEIFGRRKPFVRSTDSVAHDIAQFGERSHLIFDYEHPSFRETDEYLAELFAKLPNYDYRCYFFCWGLPSKYLLDIFSKHFSFSSICIDIQTYSEPLRKRLAGEKLIKPYFSNDELFDLIEYAEGMDNVILDGTGVSGLPLETEADRRESLHMIEHLISSYRCVRDIRPSPLHVIPGTPMTKTAQYYDLLVERRTFSDFLSFTKEAFKKNLSYYDLDRKHHPLGVYRVGSPAQNIDFCKKATALIENLHNEKRKVEMNRKGDVCRLKVTDPLTPLHTLIRALTDIRQPESIHLELSLGPRTWFHHSAIDYTSESGENCSSIVGDQRDPQNIERHLNDLFHRFISVTFDDDQKNTFGLVNRVTKNKQLLYRNVI